MPIANDLLESIKNNSPKIQALDLTQSGITDDDIAMLVDAMQGNTHLKEIKLNNNSLSMVFNPRDAFIQPNNNTKQDNYITVRGAMLLARLNTLEMLDISDNPIGNKGAKSLAQSNSIRKLTANYCNITISGKFKFLNNRSLTELWLMGDELSPSSLVNGYDISADKIIKLFASIDSDINVDFLRESLIAQNIDAKRAVLIYLNEKYKMGFYIENVISSDYKKSLIDALYELWGEQIEEVLHLNLQPYDLDAFKKEEFDRKNKKLEDAIRDAVKQEDLTKLAGLIPQLSAGINTHLVYGCTVLQYAVDADKPQVVEFLLNHGASLEVHTREYTPLFDAAEQGYYETFKVLLNHGANITGEFYFNTETAFSIAAFKMNLELNRILKMYKDQIPKLPPRCQEIANKHQAVWNTLAWADSNGQFSDNIMEDENTEPAWIRFGKDTRLTGEYSSHALILQHNLDRLAAQLSDQQLTTDVKQLTELANIYRLMHDKIAVIKKQKLLNENNYFAALGERKAFQLEHVPQTMPTLSNTNIIKNPVIEFQQNALRDRLHNEEMVNQKLVQRIPSHYQQGAAIGRGDCFFDAMAQSLNALKGSKEYTVKSLRLLCNDYVKSGKHTWMEDIIKAEGDNYEHYLVRIPFTVEELEREEKENTGLKLEDIVWGRPEIEGRMICEITKVKLHVIGILPASINGIDVTEQLVDAQALDPITIEKGPYDGSDIVHLVNHQNHFVPLINSKIFQIEKPSAQSAEVLVQLHPLESADSEPQFANLTKQVLEKIVVQLNEELKDKKESDIDWSRYPKLFVAQYRGLHYYQHYFDANQRRDHVFTSHLNRTAPAVYAMSSLLPTEHQLARESVLNENVQDLRDTLESFKTSGPVTIGSTTYQSANAQLQELMSNNYAGYRDAITKKQTPATEILCDKKALGYPHYATSDLPQHTLRYGFGKKQVASLWQHRLQPDYDQTGKPKNSYLGKIFICLFTPLAMYQHRIQHVLGQHNRNVIKLKYTVAPERETGAPGGVESTYVFYEAVLQVPDFTVWKDEHSAEFGMNLDLFNKYKAGVMQAKSAAERIAMADIIMDAIIAHKEQQLLTLAQEAAKQRGGYLIYRHNDREYGLMPESIRGAIYNISRAEKSLMQKVGDQRFNVSSIIGASAHLAVTSLPVYPPVINTTQRKRGRDNDHYPDIAAPNFKRPNNGK